METKPKRPATVWVAQVLLIVFTLLFALTLLGNTLSIINHVRTTSTLHFGFFVVIGMNLIFLTLFLSSFAGMVKRKIWSRWLGVASLSIIWILMIIGQVLRPSGPVAYYEYRSDVERSAGVATQVIITGLFLLLIITLATSKKVTAFFKDLSNS